MNLFTRLAILLIFFSSASIFANSQAPATTFLNDSSTYNGPSNNTLAFNENITLKMNPVHTLELQSGIGSFEGFGNVDAEVEYRAGNTTGFLLRFVVNDEDGTANDKITIADCVNSTPSLTVCTGSACGGKDFNTFSNITVVFNSTTNNATIHIGTANLSVNACTNATMIQGVRFMSNFLGIQGYSVKNNVVTADSTASQTSSVATSASSSPSGSGSGGFICRLDWQCAEWSDCGAGAQTRKCKLVEVPDTVILVGCPQLTIPEQYRNCTTENVMHEPAKKSNTLTIPNSSIVAGNSSSASKSPPNLTLRDKVISKSYNIDFLPILLAILLLLAIFVGYKLLKKKNKEMAKKQKK